MYPTQRKNKILRQRSNPSKSTTPRTGARISAIGGPVPRYPQYDERSGIARLKAGDGDGDGDGLAMCLDIRMHETDVGSRRAKRTTLGAAMH